MSDFAKLFESMLEQGAQMAKDFDPKSMPFSMDKMADMFPSMTPEMMETMFGKTLNKDGLDAKTRLLTLLSAQVAAQSEGKEPQIKASVRNALDAEVHEQEITEVIVQAAVYAGVPSMTKAMEIAKAVFEDRKADT